MRIPILLMIVVIVATPKDVRGLMDDLSNQMQQASVSVAQLIGTERGAVRQDVALAESRGMFVPVGQAADLASARPVMAATRQAGRRRFDGGGRSAAIHSVSSPT